MILHGDRVRTHTATAVLRRIDAETSARLQEYAEASPEEIARRLEELDQEWDMDRTIELEAATVGLIGLTLGALVRPVFLAVPAVVGGALLVHALTGWYPLLPLLRRLRVRSAREIARERYALKTLRGDFADIGERTAPATTAAATPAPQVEQSTEGSPRYS